MTRAAPPGSRKRRLVLRAATAARQRVRPGSVIDLVLLRRPAFTLGCVCGLLSYAALFGALLVVPFYPSRGAWAPRVGVAVAALVYGLSGGAAIRGVVAPSAAAAGALASLPPSAGARRQPAVSRRRLTGTSAA